MSSAEKREQVNPELTEAIAEVDQRYGRVHPQMVAARAEQDVNTLIREGQIEGLTSRPELLMMAILEKGGPLSLERAENQLYANGDIPREIKGDERRDIQQRNSTLAQNIMEARGRIEQTLTMQHLLQSKAK